MKNEKIYVVTSGCYSDYHIISATTDYETAKKLQEKFDSRYDEARIEEYDNAEVMVRPLWYIRFNTTGDVIECVECTMAYEYDSINYCYFTAAKQVAMYVLADAKEDAIKIGAEKRAQFLAEKLGL